ncbi:hypothetical protein SAMN05216368_10875 [Cryobacterium flavum]|uniref:ATP/GTP-binding protein n=1 Tax=Cryobacterium flavum TaxID=1424659 RepID=A0A4R8VII0_9MICO|nr:MULTISPECIES: hypothetical protein [Cryobacterium]TFB82182.1 hypothetical protein E3O21_00550 [Cryobacterium flavum]TFD09446.1 hypothetical protein E3T29_04720 [Cryobacterium sp. TMT1-66-1]TFD11828.1 hypothetical protein E3T35_08550 [Cryobacterium sp. TMT1-2-2]SDN90855.1 hypothetical protein SAMN05216368_10875 [Cryobacterium flavum]
MARSNRPRGRKAQQPVDDDEAVDLNHLLAGWRRSEVRRDGLWHVQPVPAKQAVKTYLCPGCTQGILPGTAHIVTWRGDGVLGDNADLSNRRHWHTHCWKIK